MADPDPAPAQSLQESASLLEDEAFLRRVLAASPDCIKVLDFDAHLLAMNKRGQQALEIVDVTPHLGTCWTDWWQEPTRTVAVAAVEAAKAGGTGRFEAATDTFGGTPKWWDVTVTAIPGTDGRPERLLSVSRDITAQRAARDVAAERLDRLQSVIKSAKDYAVISVDPAGQIDGWSSGARDTFGWSEAEAVGKPFDLIWTGEDQQAGSPGRELKVAKETGMCPDNRFHVRADGRRIFVVGACRPVHDAEARLVGFVKVCRDETDRRQTEEDLAEARRRSDAALMAGEVGTFTWDIGADRLWGDSNFARLFGLTQDGTGSFPLSNYLAAIHPDDQAATAAKIEQTVSKGVPYEAEYRIVHGDGSERWVVARGLIERDDKGKPVRFPGVIVDVTARRMAEAAFLASKRRYQRLFETMDEGFCTIRMVLEDDGAGGQRAVDYRYDEVNPAFEQQTGLVGAAGHYVRELIPDHESHWFETYGTVALTGEPARFELAATALPNF